ncbi:hypothetical protein JD844_017174 [Phrynosoma platyrhinos]|uniref:Uncharacterized protein n=1 Tax=Phrynosoma platyrhinos TaxID=52577 RepID=A0ABQ7SLG3_PHRPL|nr:hypothetical protein JD844_017174 [Phrynosoma platyrhinos]
MCIGEWLCLLRNGPLLGFGSCFRYIYNQVVNCFLLWGMPCPSSVSSCHGAWTRGQKAQSVTEVWSRGSVYETTLQSLHYPNYRPASTTKDASSNLLFSANKKYFINCLWCVSGTIAQVGEISGPFVLILRRACIAQNCEW